MHFTGGNHSGSRSMAIRLVSRHEHPLTSHNVATTVVESQLATTSTRLVVTSAASWTGSVLMPISQCGPRMPPVSWWPRSAVAAKLRPSIDGVATTVIAVWSDASPLREDWKWHGWMGRLH